MYKLQGAKRCPRWKRMLIMLYYTHVNSWAVHFDAFPGPFLTLLIRFHGLITAIRSFLVLAKEVLATIVAFEVLIQEAMQCLKHPEAALEGCGSKRFTENIWKKEVWLAWCSSEMLAKLLPYQGWIQIAPSFHPHPYPSTCLPYPKVQVSHVVPPVATQARACCGVSLPMPGYAAGSTYDRCPRRRCWPQRSRADPHHWWPQWDWRLRSSWVFGEKTLATPKKTT